MSEREIGLTPNALQMLRDLVQPMLDGDELAPQQQQYLAEMLEGQPAARREYLEMVLLHSQLSDLFGTSREDSEYRTDLPAANPPNPLIIVSNEPETNRNFSIGIDGFNGGIVLGAIFSIVALVAIGMLFYYPLNPADKSVAQSLSHVATILSTPVIERSRYLTGIARVVQSEDAVWDSGAKNLPLGCWLPPVRLNLNSGKICLAFDRGAELTVQGPADIELVSNSRVILHRGSAAAVVPSSATGFVVDTPTAKVKDIGTRFSVNVVENGESEVAVLEGEIEVSVPVAKGSSKSLFKHQAVMIDGRGLHEIDWNLSKLQLEISPIAKTFNSESVPFFHWPFDERSLAVEEGVTRFSWPEIGWHPTVGFFAAVERDSKPTPPIKTVKGMFGNAIALDGIGNILDTKLTGIGEDKPRTVCFWVKIPKVAPIENSYSIVTWGDWKKAGGKWQIGWNPNIQHDAGKKGAIRTEVCEGYVIGETDLRDDQWHHVASVYLGGSYDDIRAKFRIYVDGRLEQFTGFQTMPIRTVIESSEKVVIGKYFGLLESQKTFLGDIDELYLFDGALTPAQIQQLMVSNQPPHPTEIIPTAYFID